MINVRIKEAEALENAGGSPRSVALIRPRELGQNEVFTIFFREHALKEEYLRDLIYDTPNEELFNKNLLYDELIIDKINNEFNIEQEDYKLAVIKYEIKDDEMVIERLEELRPLQE